MSTPAPREVLKAAGWDDDHAYVQVDNSNGPAIRVEASIGSLSNRTTTEVPAGVSTRVPTAAFSAQSGQVRCWFRAYENGTLIDSMDNVPVTVTAAGTPTPPPAPPEAAIVSGTVADAATGKPISGAEVIFTSITYGKQYPPVYTDSSGTFTTARMYPDSYSVMARASGYKTMSDLEVKNIKAGVQQMTDQIRLDPVSAPSATPGPSPTPGSPVDAWMNLLYNPTVCISTVALALGAIVSATAIYEWMLRQRERRKAEERKGQEKPEGEKKP